MNMRRTLTLCRIAAALPCLVGTWLASADDTPPAKRADELFERGRTLLDEGRYPEACEAFDESMRMEPGGGTLLNLALCHELEGRFATALREYHEALDRAIADGRQDRIQLARTRLEVVTARVARFAVEIVDATGVTMTMNGVPVPKPEWGAIALDPGPHTLVVSSPGVPRFSHRFVVPREDGWRGRVRAPEAIAVAAPDSDLTARPQPRRRPDADAGERPETERTTWHWVGLGVGVLGLATSAATGVKALEAQSDAEDSCIPGRSYCPADGQAAADRANSLAWVSTVSLGAGLAGLAVWTWLPQRHVPYAVGLSPASGGVLLTTGGSF
jgi:hypothetical protein